MLVSTKGRYALRVMIELANYEKGKYVPLSKIAENQDISMKYLESIIAILSKAGLLEGLRGKGGGYRINRDAKAYSVGEVLRLTEGTLAPVACLECEQNKCERAPYCRTLPMWKGLETIISDYLDNITIGDLVETTLKNDFEL